MNVATAHATERGLERYLRDIRLYPLLDADEELRLIRRYRRKEDKAALDRLAGSHLRLVFKCKDHMGTEAEHCKAGPGGGRGDCSRPAGGLD